MQDVEITTIEFDQDGDGVTDDDLIVIEDVEE
jgi:hypothetical protein